MVMIYGTYIDTVAIIFRNLQRAANSTMHF